jgi:hypothetical protein
MQGPGHVGQLVGVAGQQGHPVAVGREPLGGRPADAPTGPGDQAHARGHDRAG